MFCRKRESGKFDWYTVHILAFINLIPIILFTFKGPPGSTGLPGPQGIQGFQGVEGLPGNQLS